MSSVVEIDLGHDRESIASVDFCDNMVAVLYHSGELLMKYEEEALPRFTAWIKNPYKIYIHPSGFYLVATSLDGLVHFFSTVDTGVRCVVELANTDMSTKTVVGESIFWLENESGNDDARRIHLLLGTLGSGLCYHIVFEFLSRSIKPLCDVVAELPLDNDSVPIRSVFYTNWSNEHTLILSTPLQLFYFSTAPCGSDVITLSQFLDEVRLQRRPFESINGSSIAWGKDVPSWARETGVFCVAFSKDDIPRSFCWVHAGGVVHGLFECNERRWWTKLERIDFSKPAERSLWSKAPVDTVRAVVPTHGHMLFLHANRCFAVHHPAGVAWYTTTESTKNPIIRDVLATAVFDSDDVELVSNSRFHGVATDGKLDRVLFYTVDRLFEVVFEEDRSRLYDLFIRHAVDPGENSVLCRRYFRAAEQYAGSRERKNSTYFLHGFYLLKIGKAEEGMLQLAQCDWFEDIFKRLEFNPILCDLFLKHRFHALSEFYRLRHFEPAQSEARRLFYICVWWKVTHSLSSSITDLIDSAFTANPELFSDKPFCDDLIELLCSNGQSHSCLLLYQNLKNYAAAISHLIKEKECERAADTLATCDIKEPRLLEVWYRFLPVLISYAPVKLLGNLRRSLAKAHRLEITIDFDPFMPAFLEYKTTHNEIPNQMHQVKLFLNSAIYKYGNVSRLLHNYYLYLLAEEGDQERLASHIQHSEYYDAWFAVNCCQRHNWSELITLLYKRLGFYGDALRVLLSQKVNDEDSLNDIKKLGSLLDSAHLKRIWKELLQKKMDSEGLSEALHVIQRSEGILNLEDLLHIVKEDSGAVEHLKDTICTQLDHYSSLCVDHAALYSSTLQAVALSKNQLHEIKQQVSYISSTQTCALCGTALLGRASSYEPYLVYPICRHAVHEECAVKKIRRIGIPAFKGTQLEKCDTVEGLAIADCVICGEVAIVEIDIPFD